MLALYSPWIIFLTFCYTCFFSEPQRILRIILVHFEHHTHLVLLIRGINHARLSKRKARAFQRINFGWTYGRFYRKREEYIIELYNTRREFLRGILYNNIAIIAIQHGKIYFLTTLAIFPIPLSEIHSSPSGKFFHTY